MSESSKIFVGLVFIALALGIPYYLVRSERERQARVDDVRRPAVELESTLLDVQGPRDRAVRLYFYRPGAIHPAAEFLTSEVRPLVDTPDVVLLARQIVLELMRGKDDGNLLFPPEARLRQVYVLEDGTAVVDFSRQTVDRLSGITSELAVIESVTRSLVDNLESIRRVRFLVEGEARPTLAGHVSIAEPFL